MKKRTLPTNVLKTYIYDKDSGHIEDLSKNSQFQHRPLPYVAWNDATEDKTPMIARVTCDEIEVCPILNKYQSATYSTQLDNTSAQDVMSTLKLNTLEERL